MKPDDQVDRELAALGFELDLVVDEDGWICVSVPALPGCFTEGTTPADARRNALEAIELVLVCERANVRRRARRAARRAVLVGTAATLGSR